METVSRSMASGSFNIETLSVHKILPLQTDVLPYSTNTVFSVGPSSFLEGYSPYQWFSTNNYMDPSTMSTFCISSLNQALASTVSDLKKTIVSTFTISTINLTNSSNVNYPKRMILPLQTLGSGVQTLLTTLAYDVFVETDYSLYLTNVNDSFTYVSTVGVFGPLQSAYNQGQTTTTRVGSNTYTHIHSKFMFPAQVPSANPVFIYPNTSSFHLEITLVSSPSATSAVAPTASVYQSGTNSLTMTFQPRLSTIV